MFDLEGDKEKGRKEKENARKESAEEGRERTKAPKSSQNFTFDLGNFQDEELPVGGDLSLDSPKFKEPLNLTYVQKLKLNVLGDNGAYLKYIPPLFQNLPEEEQILNDLLLQTTCSFQLLGKTGPFSLNASIN